MLLAEDLLLLLTDDTTGRLSAGGVVVDIMLWGATLVDLALMGRVEFSREVKTIRFLGTDWGDWTVDRLVVSDSSPTGDDVLDAAMEDVIAWKGKISVIREGRHRAGNLREILYKRLNAGKILPRQARGSVAFGYKVEVRRRITEALVEQTTPDSRTAALIALLHTTEHEPKIIYPRYARWSRVIDWPELTRRLDGAPRDTHRKLIAQWRTDRQQQLGARG